MLHCPSVGDEINPEGEVRGCDPERGLKMEQGARRNISKRKTIHKDRSFKMELKSNLIH